MKRFRLIIPRFPYFNVYSTVAMPPLGAMSVATCVRRFNGFDVEVIDENNYRGELDHAAIQQQRPADYVGFYGGLTSTIPRLYHVAQEYKAMGVTTFAGGVHINALPDEALANGIDFVVLGEAEYSLPELLKALAAGADPASIGGVVFMRDGSVVNTGKRPPLTNLDALPMPDLSLIINTKRKIQFIPVARTRGCNFSCEFCSVKDHLGPCRSASPETAYQHFTNYMEQGHKCFFVVDDNFVQDRAGTKELCRKLIDYRARTKRPLDVVVQVRAETARDHEMLYLMKKAGVTTLCIGYESPIDEDLRNMRKGLTVAKLEEYTEILRNYGFLIHGMFIFGYPTFKDSQYRPAATLKERAEQYLDFIKRTKIDTIQVMKPVPLPGTVLRQRLEAEGRVFPRSLVDWDKYDGNWLCFQPDEGCTAMDLQHYATWIMRKVYHPMQIAKFLYLIPNYPLDLAFSTCVEAWREVRRYFTRTSITTLLRRSIRNHVRMGWQHAGRAIRNANREVAKRFRNARVKSIGSLIYNSWKRSFRKERFSEILEAASREVKQRRYRVMGGTSDRG